MSTHDVQVIVKLRMTEMDDPNPEASGEIAANIIEEIVHEHYDADAIVYCEYAKDADA